MGHSRTFLLRGAGTGVTTSATGTANMVAKFTSASAIADSTITDSATETVINDAGASRVFRVESDTNTSALYVDGATFGGVGSVAIGDTNHVIAPFYVNQPALTSNPGQAFARQWIRSANPVTIGAGTASVVSALFVNEPNITLGGNAVTDAYTVWIVDAPTEGTRNGALWVGGTARVDGDITIATVGNGMFVKEGTNATMGVVTLSGAAGSAIVYTTKLTAASRIFITEQNSGGTPGVVRVTSSTNLVSFTITSSSITDTSVVAWFLIQQA